MSDHSLDGALWRAGRAGAWRKSVLPPSAYLPVFHRFCALVADLAGGAVSAGPDHIADRGPDRGPGRGADRGGGE
ncbi:hypothetical protein GCM10011316_23760 [Roseibium aquae]|uniref:Uncharacterized protein n=1 Tax=Roseibium aquae TaxID=1323746 RepID=A0A916TKP3_9HYPH|nr:hypothetical protein GCM10011316_23760 [Roseibium aquae]